MAIPNPAIPQQPLASVTCSIENEYSELEVVLVHRPGPEIDRLTPLNKERLLFEDIPYLKRMREEHEAFCEAIRSRGIRVIYLEDLLHDILQNERLRRVLINENCLLSGNPAAAQAIFDYFSPEEILDILFAGITTAELQERTGQKVSPTNIRQDVFVIDPVPNAYFSRDPAAIVHDALISCKAHFAARVRETAIVRAAFKYHSALQGTDTIYGAVGATVEDRPFTIEGGDILVINENAVAIGCSQRTRGETINTIATKLFATGRAQRVYEVNIPVAREYMHLDTVFTVIDRGVIVAYPDVVDNIVEIRRFEPMLVPDWGVVAFPITEQRRFKRVLEDEFGVPLTVVTTGNNNFRYAAREQGADGTNMFALGPSKVMSYDRNVHTNAAMKALGIEVIEVDGSELVRGLGGPRCMTMPLCRRPAHKL